ncbi:MULTISPECIES: sensor histidine kinase [Streptomyces]|uniref:histidine kinase n=2 Tax=Streptomyces tsukubensis TaxID=83656 RepID=A0A7G3UDY9_STRT9|nr:MULTISPECIES: ATP-binding protein [Streptomyces]AZK95325.1 two-component sensor histidine kinase [Streptomyces tsukubensis]MYS62978.1 HAMP domain-containing protein [Streptomyces sp. SID5473]QKM68624.1 HAMP domain-containing protein [Streptomyces tsukubensis NRRL18488]TAI43812.1 HAMP domain-containing protein [Streptomyces tsukubensis]
MRWQTGRWTEVRARIGRIVRPLSARTRIALAFGAVFLVLGGALLTVVNLLSSAGTQTEAAAIAERSEYLPSVLKDYRENGGTAGPGTVDSTAVTALDPLLADRLTDNVTDAASRQMLYWSVAALLVTALCAVAVGWWTAGRVLRPVHEMTAKARRLSARTLHERIGPDDGPDDELKELGETLDALLGRLERAFDSQRRFIANASHELRTPLATQRTAIQVGLDASSSPEELTATKQVLLDSNRRSERLIEGLLMLARGERGLENCEDVDLAEVVTEEAARHDVRAEVRNVRIRGRSVRHPVVRGNRPLLAQLVRNLVANAVAYNVPDGTVDVVVSGGAVTVTNTGPVIPAADVPALFEPFRRGEGRDRLGPGAGLGLSIVRSIAEAHGGTVTARPGPAGGLAVTVSLPVRASALREGGPGSRAGAGPLGRVVRPG